MTSTSLATSSSAISSSEVSETAPLTPHQTSRHPRLFGGGGGGGGRSPATASPSLLHRSNNRRNGGNNNNGSGVVSYCASCNNNNNNNNVVSNTESTSVLLPTSSDHNHYHHNHLHNQQQSASLSVENNNQSTTGVTKFAPDVLCCGDNSNSNDTGNTMLVSSGTSFKSGAELTASQMAGASSVIDEIYNSATVDENMRDDDTASTESRYVVPPDGGWGWVVVAASFFICFIVDSVAYSYPMIYANMTSLTIEGPVAFFIGATLMALYMITAPFASALVNVYGTRRVIVLGSILTSTGLIVSSRTAENDFYWLILTFGVMGGVGLGMMYIGAMVSVGTYFDKRRPLALALAVCGSGLGMGIFPLVAHHLFDHFGLGPALELYACFVLQGAWLGMLVWPLPPRPLHACAKPRRKDLLDRVTEWVDKLRHREESCDSLADPETIAERNKMVRAAAKYRISGLQRFESGLATPPTTPGSSLSVATTATPPASRGQSFCEQRQQNQLISTILSSNDRHAHHHHLEVIDPNGYFMSMVDPMSVSPVSPVGCAASFRRCQSLAVSRLGPDAATAKSCPQFTSLLWTPHAHHAVNSHMSFKATSRGNQPIIVGDMPAAMLFPSTEEQHATAATSNCLVPRSPKTPPSSVEMSRRRHHLQMLAVSSDQGGARAISEEQMVSSSTPYSSRSTSGVVCEVADLAEQLQPVVPNNMNSLPKYLPQPGGNPATASSHLLSSEASQAEARDVTENILETQRFPPQQQPLHPPIDSNTTAASGVRFHANRWPKRAVDRAADHAGGAGNRLVAATGCSFPVDTRNSEKFSSNNMADESGDDDMLNNGGISVNRRNVNASYRSNAGGNTMTGTTVTSSSSDFAILQASKPMPLLSAGCCMCVKKALEQSLDISLLKDSRFWILAIGNITAMMGLYQIIFVLPALAAYADNDDSQHITSVIMAVFGVTHTIGRVLTGVMSGPRFRPLLLCNTAFVLSMAVFAVFAIAQEPLAYPVLCALAALHGLCYAFFAVLSTVIIVNVFGVRKLSSCFGMITLARGLAPYLTTLAYQVAYNIGTNSNIIGGGSAAGGNNAQADASLSSSSSSSITDSGDTSNGGGAPDIDTLGQISAETRYVQRTYGVAGIIYVGIAFAFHLLLHFRYFKRRLLDVQRKPRPRLRCVSVPTPSSLSGYRLPTGRSFADDVAEETQSIGITSNGLSAAVGQPARNDGGEDGRMVPTAEEIAADNEESEDLTTKLHQESILSAPVILTPPLVYPFDVNHDHQRYDIFKLNNNNNNTSSICSDSNIKNSDSNCHRRSNNNNENNNNNISEIYEAA